jgi:hypothetical protein
LLELGQQIFAHFDGVDRWLSASLDNSIGPVTFEICGNQARNESTEALFGLPWEVLARPNGKFLAADAYRLFHVVRRLGQGAAPAPALFHDLHMLFMDADVAGESELDYMLEEAAIAKATQLARMNMGDVRRLVEVRVTVERLMSDFNGRFACCQERAFRQLP